MGVPVDLPKTRAPALGQDREPLSVTIAKDGKIYLQKQLVAGRRTGAQAHRHFQQWL